VRLSLRAEHEAIVAVRVVFEDLPSALHLDQPARRDHLEIELTRLWAAEPTIGPFGGLHSRDLQISSVDPCHASVPRWCLAPTIDSFDTLRPSPENPRARPIPANSHEEREQ